MDNMIIFDHFNGRFHADCSTILNGNLSTLSIDVFNFFVSNDLKESSDKFLIFKIFMILLINIKLLIRNFKLRIGSYNARSPFRATVPLTTSGEAILKSYAKPIREQRCMKFMGGLNNSHCGRSLIR
ncbi:hypothetical protein DERP_007426 [Dermatophagoides pteronyssinus]|uniref:Uncharacterized protein n=1 Tax=Dermatophagoides pteronyssinus TaxID=6956 RepID=A0ABQ8J4B6_DERPT|nr:hypothetical protein DERP_007426 [Dermatophagoides pteronyssinus]